MSGREVRTSRCKWCGNVLYLHGGLWGDQPNPGRTGLPLTAALICPSRDEGASFGHVPTSTGAD